MSQAISNRVEPRVYAQIERLATEDGKAYIRVEFSGFETPYSCDGRYRIRSTDEDLPMSRAKLRGMMRDAENRSNPWDGRSSGRTVDDVDEDELRRYFERGVEARRITFEYKDRRSALSRLGLLCPDGTLTNAAWVCFADRPQVGLRMGVLGNSTRTDIRDNQQVSGSLFHLVDAAETYILNNTRRAFVIDGNVSMRRQEACEAQGVPFEVTQRGGSVHVVFMRQEGIAVRKDTAESADNGKTSRQTADKAKAPPTTSRVQAKATR